jgi:hypothetical protein
MVKEILHWANNRILTVYLDLSGSILHREGDPSFRKIRAGLGYCFIQDDRSNLVDGGGGKELRFDGYSKRIRIPIESQLLPSPL